MKKIRIITIILFILLTIKTYSIPICEDTIPNNQTCNLISPIIQCTNYTYQIYNETGNLIEQGNLTTYDGSGSYNTTFTQETGTYYVKLCDNTTRELYIEGNTLGGINEVKGSMTWIAIAILLVCMTGFYGLGANMIKEKGLMPIKKLLFYLFITNSLMLGIIAFIAGINAFDPTTFRNIGLGYVGVNLFMITAFTINYTWLTLYKTYIKGKDNFIKAFRGK